MNPKVLPKDPEFLASHKEPVAKKGRGRKSLLATWALLFLMFYGVTYAIGIAPRGASLLVQFLTSPLGYESLAETETSVSASSLEDNLNVSPQIAIPVIEVNAPIIFPESRDLNILNTALAKGVVHYPGSALPGETGNVFIFGHSTGLALVHNKNYEIFNRVKELKEGDVIKLQNGSREYLYVVKTLEVKNADDARIDLASDKKLLTISTCRIIGSKESRYVVTAEFLRSYPLRTS